MYVFDVIHYIHYTYMYVYIYIVWLYSRRKHPSNHAESKGFKSTRSNWLGPELVSRKMCPDGCDKRNQVQNSHSWAWLRDVSRIMHPALGTSWFRSWSYLPFPVEQCQKTTGFLSILRYWKGTIAIHYWKILEIFGHIPVDLQSIIGNTKIYQ